MTLPGHKAWDRTKSLKMSAKIYRPAKTAMQSGKAKTHLWVLEFDQAAPRVIDPLMGYTGSGDMQQQVKLSFETHARLQKPMPRQTALPSA